MKTKDVRCIGSISLSLLVLASLLVIIVSSTAYAEAEQAPVTTPMGSSGSDEVTAASGSNRFAVWQDNTPGNFDIIERRSTDNGATLKPTQNLSTNAGASVVAQIDG